MRSLSFASTFFISFVAFIFLEKNGLITFFWQPFFKSHFKMFVVEMLVFYFCFNNNMFAKRKKKYVYSRHDSCYLAFKKWERNMDNLSNALFLLEASDSFISFANFFCANPTLYPKVCSFDVWTRENGGNCYITYCKSQQQKYFFKKFTNNRLEKNAKRDSNHCPFATQHRQLS